MSNQKYGAFVPVILFDGDDEMYGVSIGKSINLDPVGTQDEAMATALAAYQSMQGAVGYAVRGVFHGQHDR